MNFRTELFPKPLATKIDFSSKVLSLGSCFSVNIGNCLARSGFNISNNPLGTIFNPISLFRLLNTTSQDNPLNPNLFVNHNDLVLHHDLHSMFYANSEEELNIQFNVLSKQVREHIKKASHVIITLGTSFTYEHIKTRLAVSNCHKVPQTNFKKRLLTVEEMTTAFNEIAELFSSKQVILTLSPVRHTKDGLEENSSSKATLKLAIDSICSSYANIHYFPAYEIFMDDLRDYRFYKEDLIHPNQAGIDYVWGKFKSSVFTEATQKLSDKVITLKSALSHRPFNPKSEKHKIFLQKTLLKAKELSEHVNLSMEINELELRINEFRNS